MLLTGFSSELLSPPQDGLHYQASQLQPSSKNGCQPCYHLDHFKPKTKPEQPHHVKTQPIEMACAMAGFLGYFTHTVPGTKSCRTLTRTRTRTRTHTRTTVLCNYVAWGYGNPIEPLLAWYQKTVSSTQWPLGPPWRIDRLKLIGMKVLLNTSLDNVSGFGLCSLIRLWLHKVLLPKISVARPKSFCQNF